MVSQTDAVLFQSQIQQHGCERGQLRGWLVTEPRSHDIGKAIRDPVKSGNHGVISQYGLFCGWVELRGIE